MNFSFKSNTFKYLIPREHGAWAMWIAPYILGAILFGFTADVAVFGIAALLLFMTYSPASLVLKSNRNRDSLISAATLGVFLFIIPAGFLVMRCFSWTLIISGSICFLLMSIHLISRLYRKNMTLPVHMLGIAGLTMTAPLVAVVNSGTFPRSAVLLWILNFLYFFTTTFYIRLRIRLQFKASAGIKLWGKLKLGLPAITSSVVPVVIMIILTKTVFVIPFIPGIMKAIGGSILYQPEKKTKPIVLGITEIIFTLLFVVLTVWVWNI